MKKLLFILMAVALTACAAPATPAAQPVAPEPVVVTVVVEPTQAPAQPEPIVVTVVVPASPVPEQPTAAIPPTQAPAATTSTDSGSGSLVVDDLLGKGVFKAITLSGNEFSLRCVTRELTLTATAALADIKEAELFYRMVDQPKALYYSEWRSAGKLKDEGNGVFSYLLTGETVHPDLRLELGWFEFQLVGLNSGGGVIDRTQKIEQLVTYRIDCP